MARAPRQSNNDQAVIVASPPGAIQAGIAVAHDAIGSLGAQPILLVIVLLNMTFAGIAGYFMLQLERYRADNLKGMIDLMRACVLETAPLGANSDRIRALEEALIHERGQNPEITKEP